MDKLTAGIAHKFENDINSDYIISSRYKRDTTDCQALKKYLFADIRDNFIGKVIDGDIIAAGENFGCGSAMEAAAQVLRAAGFRVIIAKSFARSFYRNAMNNGILLIEADMSFLNDGESVCVERDENDGLWLTTCSGRVSLGKIGAINEALFNEGGLIEYVNKHGSLPG